MVEFLNDPIARFDAALHNAEARKMPQANAMALATVDDSGRPSVRMVLLKGTDQRGFVFYTNLGSRKARELAANPVASLCFHWAELEEQVRVEGDVVPVSDEEADAYFASRNRGSQIGAWASKQSQPLGSRSELEKALADVEARFAGQPVTRPPFWSGFLVKPRVIEFWYGRPDRLHERVVYTRAADGSWSTQALYP